MYLEGRVKNALLPNGLRYMYRFRRSYRKARKKFDEDDKRFNLTIFRKETIRIIFDLLHGIDHDEVRDEIPSKLIVHFYTHIFHPKIR